MRFRITAWVLAAVWAATSATASGMVLSNPGSERFQSYWYPKGAEISRFSLKQSRYGEIHEGEAVLLFVTESMDPDRQVKADRPGPEDVPVIKLNATRKFFTGIYPYSLMTSVFSPVDAARLPLPLKITFTGQEWCGHVFTQMNLGKDRYRVQIRSYFESEGDRNLVVDRAIPEDALFNLIRVSPADLPLGRFDMIPSTLYSRLLHRPLKPQAVHAELQDTEARSIEGEALVAYRVRFPAEERILTIRFETGFPHRIQSWEDTHRSLPQFGGRRLTTRAERTHTLMTDYWNKNTNEHRRLLEQLGIDPN